MCNALIARATETLAGGEIFRLIEEDQQKEAVTLLQTSIKVHKGEVTIKQQETLCVLYVHPRLIEKQYRTWEECAK